MKYCTKCKTKKPISSYFNNKSKKDGLSNWCKDCVREGEDHTLEDARNWYNEWKGKQGCKKCNERRPYVLDLHHIDSSREGNKYKLISRIISSGTFKFETRKQKILKEAENCIILCSNCHREFHYLERYNNINIDQYLNAQVSPHAYTM
jgi:hypothetical protein